MLAGLSAACFLGLTTATPAEAHRDGCHRWHSCPSDTGSYVCGDLGYYSGCPGGGPELPSVPGDTGTSTDFDPPADPVVGTVTVVRGQVRLPVTAEAGSRISVRESDREVAAATATGRAQSVAFRAKDGVHEYTVYATDAAGNESLLPVDARADVDGTPPEIRALTVETAKPSSVSSTLRFTTEPNAPYEIRVSGRTGIVPGTADQAGAVTVELWLPNGRYRLSVVAKDRAGNLRRTATSLAVAVARPTLQLKRTSADGVSPVVFAVTGPRRSTGAVTVAGKSVKFALADADRAEVRVPLADGRYPSVQAALTDAVGRRATASLPNLVVDTVAPGLKVEVDSERAAHGELSVGVTTEPGSTVVVDAGAAGRREFSASQDTTAVTFPAETGDHQVVVTSTDKVGNRARQPLTVAVSTPLTAGDVAVGLVALAFLLGVPVLIGVVLWRRRARIAAWRARRRAAAAQRAVVAAHQKAVADHRAALAAHAAERDRWRQAHDQWRHRREVLQSHVDTAQHEHGSRPPDFAAVKLRSDERVYETVDGGRVEMRRSGNTVQRQVTQVGTVTVTSHRIVFAGPKRREWSYDKLTEVSHPAPTQTVLVVTNRQNPSGVDYTGPAAERVRLLIDLTIADHRGRRSDVVAQLRRNLATHDQQEPREPTDPPPAPLIPPVVIPAPAGGQRPTATVR